MAFSKKSGILPWTKENIDNVLDTYGIYILRRDTTIVGILYIGMASKGRLRERILEHFNSNDIPGVNFFDWYETITENDAKVLENFWITKYAPIYNKQT